MSASPRRRKQVLRGVGFVGLGLGLTMTLACLDRPMKRAIPTPVPVWVAQVPQRDTRDVDLLFVIDDSGSMQDVQELLRAQFSALMAKLRTVRGGLPSVHIGVTSTDIGAGANGSGLGCPPPGDEGKLLVGSCANPQGAPYLVDAEPTGCTVDKQLDPNGKLLACGANDCTQAQCTEPGTTLVVDAMGCPRCRNYEGQSLEDVFSCMADLGISGCGFEQPLEAMRKALEPENTANAGFLRDDVLLSVVIISDEDDCSASTPQLFDGTQTDLGSPLGPYSFRCFEFGVTCDVNGRGQGVRHGCVPREDQGALLYPISRYVDFLHALRPPEQLVVAAIAGPTNGGEVTVGLDPQGYLSPTFSCSTPTGGAVPAVRLEAFVNALHADVDMDWAFSSVCNPSYSEALEGVANEIAVLLDSCPPGPLDGCADPAAALGDPGDGMACNDVCEPMCRVYDKRDDQKSELPRCLEVCPEGPCPENTDPARAYAGGHPEKRDPALPVTACWQVGYNEQCGEARGAEIVISRQEDPPSRTLAQIVCRTLVPHEELCNDGADNDQDCLTDADDPDCRGE